MVTTGAPTTKIPRRGWWLLAPLLTAVPLLLFGGIYSLSQLSTASDSVEHTYDVRISLAGLLSTMVDAETGVRGFAITGERKFLEPYDRAEAIWQTQLAHIRTLTSDNPNQQHRLARFESVARDRVDLLAKMRGDYDAGRRGAELAPAMLQAKQDMDAMRFLVADLQQEETRLDQVRQQERRHRWRMTLWLFVLGAVVFQTTIFVGWRLRDRAEARHRRAEEHFRHMVENVKDYAILTLDLQGRVTSWNRGAQLIKGYRADEIIGQHFSKFYLPEEAQSGKCERELETVAREGRFEEEGWRLRKDGTRFWANVVINGIKDSRGHLIGFTKVTRDLTERKMATEALASEYQRRTEAERESRFAQMFIGILGHDLRNPLNAISMAARLVKKKMGKEDPKVIDRIALSAQRMSNMVDQLLDLTRSRLAGGIPVVKKATDLSSIVSGVVEELRLAHPDRDIRWSPLVEGEPHCAWDPDRMAQVVSNLVGNAIQYSDAAKPVTVRLTAQEHDLVLSVHNDGPPIPAELLPHLFEPYRRSAVRDERSKGLGLGLFITQQVVQAHGGQVDVRSTAEGGTTFTVTMPCAAPAHQVGAGGTGLVR